MEEQAEEQTDVGCKQLTDMALRLLIFDSGDGNCLTGRVGPGLPSFHQPCSTISHPKDLHSPLDLELSALLICRR